MTRLTVDELEVLTPDQLGKLLLLEVCKESMDFQFIQDLIAVGCPIDIMDETGWAALHYAARFGNLEVVRLLVSKGADIQDRAYHDMTPLHLAALGGHIEVVSFLLSIGADIHIRNASGLTAWDYTNRETRKAVPELKP